MTHERFVRLALTLILAALVANVFKPQIQQFLSPPATAQEEEKTAAGELRVPSNLIVEGDIIAKGSIRLDKDMVAKGTLQGAAIQADRIKTGSLSLDGDLIVAGSTTCDDLTVKKMLSAQNAQIAQALSAENIAVSKDLHVTERAVIENIAVREIKDLNDALDKSQSKIIDEIVARTIVVLRAIEQP